MAESMASFLTENLDELMSCKRDLIREEEDQIAWLYKGLQLLIAFLKDLQIKFKDHEGAKNLEARIRDVVYEAETAVDLFLANTVLKEAEEENMITKLTKKISFRPKKLMKKIGILGRSLTLGHVKIEIEVIKTEMNEMYDKRTCGVQTVNNVGNFSIDRDTSRATNSSKWEGEEETMVGFEQETMILKEQLTGGSKQLKIISIVGMAGQGKTTLATRVYNDSFVTYYFPDTRAWITVSQEYQKRDLLLGLLRSVLQIQHKRDLLLGLLSSVLQIHQISDNSDEVLAQKLYKSLKGRRYFIVMDDIWDHRAWFDLENCFPDDNNGSRIMFTSRHEHVALLSKPMSFPPLSLRSLSPNESWNLLRQKIFQRETCPSELMGIGKQIAQKCQGLPLAIVVVAGILRNEEKIRERWMQVGQTLNSQIAMDQELWSKTIALSYNHLPAHLKPCFLYFAIFPEDFQIHVWKLIWLWVAEGFIRKTGKKSLEDVAEEYLMDLIGRKLVFVSRRGYDDRIKACGIHDLLREFCLQKAEEEYFLQRIMGKLLVSTSSYSSSLTSSIPLVCIDSTPAPKYIRSLFRLHGSFDGYHGRPNYHFKLLRVLHFSSSSESCWIEGQLVLLRYLDLEFLPDHCLPVSISNLLNLETLLISEKCDSDFYLPHSIRKMVKLRHVRITGPKRNIFIRSGGLVDYPFCMDNLQTLSWINPRSCTDVLARSPNLRKLGLQISGRSSLLPNLDSLDFLNHVQELKLKFGREHNLRTTKFPPNLTKLTLWGTRLCSGDMSILANSLPNLEALKLSRMSLQGPCWEASGVFPKLKFLKFKSLQILGWIASSEDFPSLERLVLEQCYRLRKIPFEIGDLLTLKTIELHDCNRSLAFSARQIKEDQESQGNIGLQIKIIN
ncbi:putative late blight resistance protein homolog R1A-10 [Rhododendron vialii]|uniref:putative late blight resistance protein homolog R1A-10 n=1 Tax=Rhododendron vialii TaxID=182163 RepID=UPI00265F5132|nr:putative late blight resistance protein homolog R1A-10 [Rhododendron vialii]